VLILWKVRLTSINLLYFIFLFEAFLLVALLDFKTHYIYPQPILFAFALRILWLAFYQNHLWLDSLIGMAVGAGTFHFISYFYQVFRGRVGLGEGDATLLGLIGFCFGWKVLLPTIFMSAISGLVGGGLFLLFKKKGIREEIPFAPWMMVGIFCVWIVGEKKISSLITIFS
jgi:leader peptidase (prepilin peptidase)/N-methyltransferase